MIAAIASVGCKKKPAGEQPGSATAAGSAATASGSAAGSAAAPPVQTAEGAAVGTLPVVADCPKSLGGSEAVARTIKKECGPIIVTGEYDVNGSLTLEAGVVLKVQDGAEIDIGYSTPAKIFVKGTEQEPVVMTSAGDPGPGAWKGLRLYDKAARSQIAGLVVENAGGDKGALYVNATDVSLKGTTIRNAKDLGLVVDRLGRFTELSGNTFAKAGKIAVTIFPAAVGDLGVNKFDDGAFVQIEGGNLEDSARWQNPGAPYVVVGDVAVDGKNGRATLEIQAGTELRIKGAELDIGYSRDARLIVAGTPDKPVVFTTAEDKAPGQWKHIGIYSKGEATITNATIAYGGSVDDHGALLVDQGTVSVTATTFTDNKRAVHVRNGAKLKAFDQNKLSASPEPALTIIADQVAGLGTANTFDKDAHIEVQGGPLKGAVTWNPQTVPYEIMSEVSVDRATLTLPPGSDLAFDASAQLSIGYGGEGTLKAIGTPDKPIKLHARHDEAPWKGVFLYSNALNCELSNIVLGHTAGDAGIFVDHQAVAKISDASCTGCANGTLTSRCGARLTATNIKAGPDTPKGEIKPDCPK